MGHGVFLKPEYDVFVQYFLKTTKETELGSTILKDPINVQIRSLFSTLVLTIINYGPNSQVLESFPKVEIESYMYVNSIP